MSDKSESVKALDAAIINLASLYEYGHLMASVNPTAWSCVSVWPSARENMKNHVKWTDTGEIHE